MMGFDYGYGPFGFFGGWLMMFLWWGLIIFGIIMLVKWLGGVSGNGRVGASGKSAMDVLKERYANGEIGRDEFESMKKDILK